MQLIHIAPDQMNHEHMKPPGKRRKHQIITATLQNRKQKFHEISNLSKRSKNPLQSTLHYNGQHIVDCDDGLLLFTGEGENMTPGTRNHCSAFSPAI